jgi:MFS family permease
MHKEGMKGQMTQKIFTRDFIFVFTAHFSLTFIFYILIPTLPIYLTRSGESEIETGILIGIFFFAALVLRPFVGRALSKTPEKKFMMIGALLYTLTSVAYILAPPFLPFLIVRVFQGIGFAFFHTASYTLVANITPEAHRGQGLSVFYMATTISSALAPPLGIFLINQFSFTLLFLFCLGISLWVLFITNRFGKRQITALPRSSVEDSVFLSRKALSPSIINSFALFIWGALTAFFPIYSIRCGVTNPGLFFAAIAVILILVRSLGGNILDLHSKERIILPCLFTYIISMVILAFSKTLPMFFVVAVIWGIGSAFLSPTVTAYTLDRAGSSPGPVMGTFTAISDLGYSLGPMVMGVILQLTSYPTMFLCLAFTGFINLNYFYFLVRKKGEGRA